MAKGPRRQRQSLYVIGSLDFGGAELHLRLITPELKEKGWQPIIYCLTKKGAQATDVEAAGVEVIAPPLASLAEASIRPLRALQLLAAALKLFGVMVWRRPRIAHFFLPGAYLIGGPLALLARIPVRIMSRRSLDAYQANWPALRRIELWLHRRMHLILGNSEPVVAQLIEREGCPPERVRLIHNGIDTSRYGARDGRSATRQALGLEPDATLLVIVANLIPYKGHADLMRGLAQAAADMPSQWTLIAIGRDDGIGGELGALAEELGLTPHIQFLGQRRDVPDLLAASDIAVLCSHQEGFSNAILEAMATGLPLVATDVGGNGDAVVDGETGLLVPAHDPAALGAAIQRLATSPEEARAMGAAGQRRVEALFSLKTCVSKYDAIYEALVAGRTPP